MLRQGTQSDHDALGAVMYDAVRNGRSAYSQIQREAWTPAPRSGPEWSARLAAQTVIVDEADGVVRGFMTLARGGYIDLAYIRPAFQGSGLFRQLFDEVRRVAVRQGETRLRVHASLMAQPAFSVMGFEIVRKETVELGGQTFERFEMEMPLAGG